MAPWPPKFGSAPASCCAVGHRSTSLATATACSGLCRTVRMYGTEDWHAELRLSACVEVGEIGICMTETTTTVTIC